MGDPTVLELIHEDVKEIRKQMEAMRTRAEEQGKQFSTLIAEFTPVKAASHEPATCPMNKRFIWLSGAAAALIALFEIVTRFWSSIKAVLVRNM